MTEKESNEVINRIVALEQTLGARIDDLEKRMITKADVFQAVLTVQAFFAATIVGTIIVLNSVGSLS